MTKELIEEIDKQANDPNYSAEFRAYFLLDNFPKLRALALAGQKLRNTKDIYFCGIEYSGKGPCSHCDALAVYDSSTKEVS